MTDATTASRAALDEMMNDYSWSVNPVVYYPKRSTRVEAVPLLDRGVALVVAVALLVCAGVIAAWRTGRRRRER